MPRYRLLALDIDGTLLNSRHELSPATRDALMRAKREGIELVLATGRRYSKTLPLVAPLGLDVPLVTHGGALVKHPGDHRTLFSASFDEALLRAAVRAVEIAGFEMLLYADTFHDKFDFYARCLAVDEPHLAEYLALNPDCGRLWPEWPHTLPPSVFAGFAMGSREAMLALAGRVERSLEGSVETVVLRSPFYRGHMCELTPRGVNKWSGVCRLADAWGIAAEEICAVGDDLNDLPMIEGAGLGVAMENALPEVKRRARRIAPGHDADGLVEVVRWLLED